MPPTVAPYGSWKSPITPDHLVADFVGLGGISLDGADVWWNELRPADQGRNVLVRCTPPGSPQDMTPQGFSARTRVHEYGGGEYIATEGVVYFSNFADQRVYRQQPGAAPEPLTPEVDLRYADYVLDSRRRRLICIREDHRDTSREAVNTIVSLPLPDGGEGRVLISGADFYSTPRLNPDGTQLAWLSWNYPNMPWDGNELWVAPVSDDGSLGTPRLVAGGRSESIFQPEWSPGGVLHFVSDRTGWWNLYRLRNGAVEALHPMEAEFGLPHWLFGWRTYGFESDTSIVCFYGQSGLDHLARLDTLSGTLQPIDTPFTYIRNLRVQPGRAAFIGGSARHPAQVVLMDLPSGRMQTLRRAREISVDTGYLPEPQPIEFPTTGGLTAHAFYYPPTNPDFTAPEGDRPPLIVESHGGPTGATVPLFNYTIPFWTSRGFAVVDVNYGGSSGYGREYRERLNGNWGVVDVDDCVSAARYLVDQGLADPKRLIITGGSAGGFTTLAALAFRDVFTAGSSHFGIGDLEVFVKDTHKFESRYLDSLVGPYPERRDLYVERSPITYVRNLSAPMILFQGLEDKIVPPNQARLMFEAVRARELPVALLEFEGEQHGFRKKENITRAIEAELYFYSKVFGFALPEPVKPVDIENLD